MSRALTRMTLRRTEGRWGFGMIGLENYYALRSRGLGGYDEVWVAMRSAPRDMPPEFYHVPELAPSWNLFQLFLSLKKHDNWNQDTFNDLFVPHYIREFAGSPRALESFQELLMKVRAGRSITVVCTCYYEGRCHRAILGGIVQGMAPDIEVRAAGDYRRFWDEMNSL